MPASGQVVVGGYNGNTLSSVELFPLPSSDTCSIPDLPQARRVHSLSLLSGGRLVVCGGSVAGGYVDSCISWVAGKSSWTPFHTMRCLIPIMLSNHLHNHSMARAWHTAWTPPSLPDSIVLLGGHSREAQLTAEIVPGV